MMAARLQLRRCLLVLLLLLSSPCAAAPAVTFPINSQVPPVARISQPFSFVFSPSTFSSPRPMTYALVDAPRWLSIDSAARRLFGTPEEADVAPGAVVGVPIHIVATDDSGSTTHDATLVVSRNPPPAVSRPVADQITGFGQPYSAPASLLSYPSRPFAFAFAPDTFSPPGLNYYAVSGDNSPLPAWISFDPGRLAFAGTTPPFESLVQPPQAFLFALVASDVTGFAAVAVQFSVVVGNHELAVDDPTVTLDVTAGTPVSLDILRRITYDGKPITPDFVKSVESKGLPDWLALDKRSLVVSGTPPASVAAGTFSVAVVDTADDMLNIEVLIKPSGSTSSIFKANLSDIVVQRGKQFSIDLTTYLWNPNDVSLSVDWTPHAEWIQFDSAKSIISGTVPVSASAAEIFVALNAASKSSAAKEARTFVLSVSAADKTTSLNPSTFNTRVQLTEQASSTGSPSFFKDGRPSPSATGTDGAGANTNNGAGTPTSPSSLSPSASAPPVPATSSGNSTSLATGSLVLAILLPVVFVSALLVLLVLLCCRRRRERSRKRRLARSIRARDISLPIPESFVVNGGTATPEARTIASAEGFAVAARGSSSLGGGGGARKEKGIRFAGPIGAALRGWKARVLSGDDDGAASALFGGREASASRAMLREQESLHDLAKQYDRGSMHPTVVTPLPGQDAFTKFEVPFPAGFPASCASLPLQLPPLATAPGTAGAASFPRGPYHRLRRSRTSSGRLNTASGATASVSAESDRYNSGIEDAVLAAAEAAGMRSASDNAARMRGSNDATNTAAGYADSLTSRLTDSDTEPGRGGAGKQARPTEGRGEAGPDEADDDAADPRSSQAARSFLSDTSVYDGDAAASTTPSLDAGLPPPSSMGPPQHGRRPPSIQHTPDVAYGGGSNVPTAAAARLGPSLMDRALAPPKQRGRPATPLQQRQQQQHQAADAATSGQGQGRTAPMPPDRGQSESPVVPPSGPAVRSPAPPTPVSKDTPDAQRQQRVGLRAVRQGSGGGIAGGGGPGGQADHPSTPSLLPPLPPLPPLALLRQQQQQEARGGGDNRPGTAAKNSTSQPTRPPPPTQAQSQPQQQQQLQQRPPGPAGAALAKTQDRWRALRKRASRDRELGGSGVVGAPALAEGTANWRRLPPRNSLGIAFDADDESGDDPFMDRRPAGGGRENHSDNKHQRGKLAGLPTRPPPPPPPRASLLPTPVPTPRGDGSERRAATGGGDHRSSPPPPTGGGGAVPQLPPIMPRHSRSDALSWAKVGALPGPGAASGWAAGAEAGWEGAEGGGGEEEEEEDESGRGRGRGRGVGGAGGVADMVMASRDHLSNNLAREGGDYAVYI